MGFSGFRHERGRRKIGSQGSTEQRRKEEMREAGNFSLNSPNSKCVEALQ